MNKLHNRRMQAAMMLMLCVIISVSLLFAQLVEYTAVDTTRYIPLTRSNGITTVREGQRQADGSVTFRSVSYHPDNHRLLTAKPNVRASNQKPVWVSSTNLEIFSVSYVNGQKSVTVSGQDGEKVIAPGTEQTFDIGLYNDSNMSLDYDVEFHAFCEIIRKGATYTEDELFEKVSTFEIPVNAAITYKTNNDEQSKYLFGSAEEKPPVTDMVNVTHEGTVGKNKYISYELKWEWPFEGDDTLDTYLGNMASDLAKDNQEIRLTISVVANAEQATNPNADDGIPKTGDTSGIALWMTFMLVSAAGLMLLIILLRPRGEKNETR